MKALVAIAAFSGLACAQDSGLKARELFYTPPPAETAPAKKSPAKPPVAKQTAPPSPKQNSVPVVNAANVPLGLRYSVMKRDASGKFIEVDQDSTFRSGDRIRLSVDTNTPGYLYVVMQGSSGNWRLLFPSADVEGGNNRIDKGVSQQIPAGDKGQFVFDDQSGTEKLFLVLSRRPEADLDKLIYSITGTSAEGDRKLMASASIGGDVVSRLRDEVKSRDLVFEKVDEMSLKYDGTNDVKTEKATYVVNPSKGEDARLVVDVALKHGK
ncbi:MAG TPA: DUF4384 domain-containing protein [Bryobacteraceae bacterium]|jgi:hypothetical protein|nr:DUF4384 domain-containing protein [Bryobacteraceae bacterium]